MLDPESFCDLVQQHGPRLLRLARRTAPPGVDPDDLVQETFERAWRARATFREEAAVSTWLHAILVNRVRELRRRRSVSEVIRELVDQARLPSLSINDPQALVALAEREDDLRRALATLPLPERTAVALHDGEGLPTALVAEFCQCSTAAAHKRIQRGRLHLAAAFQRMTKRDGGPAPPLACRRARQSITAYLDGELSATQKEAVETHVAQCTHCPPLLQALSGVLSELASKDAPTLPPQLLQRLRHVAAQGAE